MRAAISSPMMDTAPARSRLISGIGIFRIQRASRRWHRSGSRSFFEIDKQGTAWTRAPRPPDDALVPTIAGCLSWISLFGCDGKYEAPFRENEIDETVLPSLTHETLKELGVTAVGHRLKLSMPLRLCVAPPAARCPPLTQGPRRIPQALTRKTAPNAAK
jgi:hypothetical protein